MYEYEGKTHEYIVALFTGAWIEIGNVWYWDLPNMSRALYGRVD